ncbi:MAG: ribosome silencing factor [Lachnospiraceae bacterium]|nr:ribosome silencing factor [Lachnospiraceae bacterium]
MSISMKMAKLAVTALEEKKAADIRIIDIGKVSVLGDFFIIATGNNRNQIQTMSNEVERVLGMKGYQIKQVEGYETANWILLDYGDIIIHLFDKENRIFYNLERIWRDGKDIAITSIMD